MATLGIDLGGTYARAAVVDADGHIVAQEKRAHGGGSPEKVAGVLAAVAHAAMARVPLVPVYGVGVGLAGQIRDNGVVYVAPNLGWHEVEFGRLLETALGREITLVNDLSAAAWGEFRAGAGKGEDVLLMISVGSGVGSAFISGGKLLSGASGVACEFGHVKVQPGGRLCGCGERGCLEAYVGGHSLAEQARELLAGPRGEGLSRLSFGTRPVDGRLLEEAAHAGDPVASELFHRAGALLGLAVANQVTMLNPGRLIVGGGTLHHVPGLKAALVEGVRAHASLVSSRAVTIVDAALGDDAGLIGAALLAA